MPSISRVLECIRQCPAMVNGVRVTGNARLLLITLALNPTDGDRTMCIVSRADLMRETAMSEGTLDAQLAALTRAGLLESRWETIEGKLVYVRRLLLKRSEITAKPVADHSAKPVPELQCKEGNPYQPWKVEWIEKCLGIALDDLSAKGYSETSVMRLCKNDDYFKAMICRKFPNVRFSTIPETAKAYEQIRAEIIR